MGKLPDFEAWAVFAKVAQTGAFARAAQDLDLSKATVSKAVTRLEARLGTSLFHRTSRRLSLTESGRSALDRAQRLLAEGEAVELETMAQSTVPQGLVRLAAPMSFGLRHVAPHLPDFFRAYPDISIDLDLSDQRLDLVARGFDLGVRIGVLPDSALLSRRLCAVRMVLVGAPSYFEGRPRPTEPKDLVWHQALTYAYALTPEVWRFATADGQEQSVTVSGPLQVNNSDALMPMLLAGQGLALLPEFFVWSEIAEGRLEAVMCDWRAPDIGLHLVTPPGRLRPLRVKVLQDFLAERLSAAPWAMA